MHLWTYLVLRIGGGDALAQMVQTGDWNTDACIKAGQDVLALNALNPYQDGYKGAAYNNEAAAVGNGKAAMELMGQWAPAVQKDQSADKKGLGDDLGWFPFPTVDRRRGRRHRRRRRRQRHRGRQGRAAGGGRLPEVLHQRRQPEQAQHRRRRPLDRPSAPRAPSPTRTCRPSSPVAGKAQFMQLYLDQATAGTVGQAINDATVALFPGASTRREGLPGDHRRRGHPVGPNLRARRS